MVFELLTLRIQDFSDVPENGGWLSAGERETLAGLRFPKRRNDWRLGRWTVKLAILAFLRLGQDADLSMFEIRAAADGAPEAFLRDKPAGVAISISHSGGRSFCAAGPPDSALGCDIEQLEPRGELLAANYFTPEEIELVRAAAPENKMLITNLIWSAKESVLKVLREGLRRDTRDISIQPDLSGIFQCGDARHRHGDAKHCVSTASRWTGLCRQTLREFHGRWRADLRFVYTYSIQKTIPFYEISQ